MRNRRDDAYLSLVSRSRTRGQHALLDVCRRQMVQYGMVWHDQYTAIVLCRSGSVQNALAKEHGK
jgi:hypothetical protein